MPDDMFAYAEAAAGRGLKAIIAGAGGAAHLPGMIAAKTTVPVLGVPVASRHLQGVDSLHSIVQMPKGIPVATFAIGTAGAANAALFAVALLANETPRCASARSLPRRADRSGPQHDLAPAAMSAHPNRSCPHAGRAGRRPAGPHVRAPAQAMGYFTAVLDADPTSPAGLVSHHHIQTGYEDPPAWPSWPACDAVTTEFENVPAGALAALAAQRPCRPPPRRGRRAGPRPRKPTSCLRRALRALCGDRDGRAAGRRAPDLLPGILKTARMGYDGKGQVRVKTRRRAGRRLGRRQVPCVLKKCCRWRWNARSSWRAAPTAPWCTCPCSATCTATAFWP
jgi:phosphoribosylaminoimidazole carboxylase PurE protein